MARRPHGTGSLYVRKDAAGRETWYGHWRSNRRQVKKKIGPKRAPGSRDGLTRTQAEEELRAKMREVDPTPKVGEALTIEEVSALYVARAKRRGRKRSTLEDIESDTRVHLKAFFGDKALDSIKRGDVKDFVSTLEEKDLAPKTIRDIVATLSALFNFAKVGEDERRWATENPCEGLELPAVPERTEIHFLTLEEVDAAVANVPKGIYRAIDKAIILTAAMSGLRKGELVALRWRDIDWPAARIRVRQNYVRKEFGTPKSKRSTRSVPMADEVGGELERLFRASSFQGDDDLVFAHPATGEPMPKANVTRRFRKALKAAGLDESHRFHDLRHSFGTRMAAAGVPMRMLQQWMGHVHLTTTEIYADYAPSPQEAQMVNAAFAREAPDQGLGASRGNAVVAN